MILPMNTGAEAVETAIKAARRWGYDRKGIEKDKAELIVCEGNFHGRTLGAVSLSSDEEYKRGFGPLLPGVKTIPYGDIDQLQEAITVNTAAFIVEPIQGRLVLSFHLKALWKKPINYVRLIMFCLLPMKFKQDCQEQVNYLRVSGTVLYQICIF